MKLTDLNPEFLGNGGSGVRDKDGNEVRHRPAIGLALDCPCGGGERMFVAFENPLDGGPRLEGMGAYWKRTGDTFETLTLTPSLQRRDPKGCRWHGSIENGAIRNA